jgi:hypothetical protein
MFGSFLPSLGRQATKFTQVESRHCYEIKWNLLGKTLVFRRRKFGGALGNTFGGGCSTG